MRLAAATLFLAVYSGCNGDGLNANPNGTPMQTPDLAGPAPESSPTSGGLAGFCAGSGGPAEAWLMPPMPLRVPPILPPMPPPVPALERPSPASLNPPRPLRLRSGVMLPNARGLGTAGT